jgi:hypothetical protein
MLLLTNSKTFKLFSVCRYKMFEHAAHAAGRINKFWFSREAKGASCGAKKELRRRRPVGTICDLRAIKPCVSLSFCSRATFLAHPPILSAFVPHLTKGSGNSNVRSHDRISGSIYYIALLVITAHVLPPRNPRSATFLVKCPKILCLQHAQTNRSSYFSLQKTDPRLCFLLICQSNQTFCK